VTELAKHPLAQALEATPPTRRGQRPSAKSEQASTAQSGAALFAEVVWAHHRWEADRRRSGEPDALLERDYRNKLAEFQKQEGGLEQVYWSTREASAVAMTVKTGNRGLTHRLRLRERDDVVSLHRLSDWVTRDCPHVADLLQECDLLAIRVGEVLRGTSERIAMRWILGIQAHLLGFFERTSSLPDEKAERELVDAQEKKLDEVEEYYHRAASKTGRIVYVSGMLIGVLLAATFGLLAGLLLWSLGARGDELRLPLLCYGAGALGALVSAMSRMGRPERGRFNIDFELGRPLMRRLGVYRPFVGAVIGVALYFLLASGILDLTVEEAKEPYYYGFAAFLSGFSERFATVIFGAAERRLAPGEDKEEGARGDGEGQRG
jgi:hypothetical protein